MDLSAQCVTWEVCTGCVRVLHHRTTWLLSSSVIASLCTRAQFLSSKIKGLQQMVSNALFFYHTVPGGSGQALFVLYSVLGQYLRPKFPLNPPLFLFPLPPSPTQSPSNSHPQNSLKMSWLPKLQPAPAPVRALRFDNNENGLGSAGFLQSLPQRLTSTPNFVPLPNGETLLFLVRNLNQSICRGRREEGTLAPCSPSPGCLG